MAKLSFKGFALSLVLFSSVQAQGKVRPKKAHRELTEEIGADVKKLLAQHSCDVKEVLPGVAPDDPINFINGNATVNKIVEGDAVYEQISVLDEIAKEAHIIVPYHNARAFINGKGAKQLAVPEFAFERVGARFICGLEYLTSITNDYCVMEPLPPGVHIDNFRNLGPSTKDNIDAAISDVRKKVHMTLRDLGEVTNDYRATLSASVQKVCTGKPIRLTEAVEVDEDAFNFLSSNATVETEAPKSNLPGCTNVQSVCSYRPGNGWCGNFPIGSGSDYHQLRITKVCVDCCADEDAEGECSCAPGAPLNSTNYNERRNAWEVCYGKTYGGCKLGSRPCPLPDGDCLDYKYQCHEGEPKCFGGMIPCGEEECIGPIGAYGSTDYPKKNCTIDGVQMCIPKNDPCGPQCPKGTVPCGSGNSFQCIAEEDKDYYWGCDGTCISIATPCNGTCNDPSFIDCEGRCVSSQYWRDCDGKCIKNTEQCPSDPEPCPLTMVPCGIELCLYPDDDDQQPNNASYYSCGDECLPNKVPCPLLPEDCREGFIYCDGECYNNQDDTIWTCGDRCLSKLKPCNESCPPCYEGYFPCGEDCIPDSIAKDYRECNGKCQSSEYPCPNFCPPPPPDCENLQCIDVDTPEAAPFNGIYGKTDELCGNSPIYNLGAPEVLSDVIVSRASNGYWWITIKDFACENNGYAYLDCPGMECPGDIPNCQLKRGGTNVNVTGSILGLRVCPIVELLDLNTARLNLPSYLASNATSS